MYNGKNMIMFFYRQFAEGVAKNNKKKKIQLDESVNQDQAVHVIQSQHGPAN